MNWKVDNYNSEKWKKIFSRYKGRRFVGRSKTWKTAVLMTLCICVLAAGIVFSAVLFFGNVSSSPEKTLEQEPTASPTVSPVSSEKDLGLLVALDAGHGGVQPGCVAGEVLEKDITFAVTMQLKEKLEEMGFSVLLTRKGDEDIELAERADIANQSDACCFVSIHCNWYEEDASVSGLDCYYFGDEAAKALAESILERISNASITTRDIKEENFQVLRETNMPATLIELGFMTNPEELESLTSAEYQEKLAIAIAEGIEKEMAGKTTEVSETS